MVPFESSAEAVNCAVNPTFGAVPATATDETVGVGVVAVSLLLLLQPTAVATTAARTLRSDERRERILIS